MSGWTARRFWTDAQTVALNTGFTVHLDARPVRTPLKAPLVVPSLGLAQAIAAEWQAQGAKVNPETMPFTRTANSAIDKVAPQRQAVVAMLAEYGDSDLLCYRAEGPDALTLRQSAAWNPVLRWAKDALDAPLITAVGVMHVDQPRGSLEKLREAVDGLDPFRLAAFHDLVAISGSLVLALAVTHRTLTAESAWDLSRIDENWQIDLWGEDEEATRTAALKRGAFLQADRFYGLCG